MPENNSVFQHLENSTPPTPTPYFHFRWSGNFGWHGKTDTIHKCFWLLPSSLLVTTVIYKTKTKHTKKISASLKMIISCNIQTLDIFMIDILCKSVLNNCRLDHAIKWACMDSKHLSCNSVQPENHGYNINFYMSLPPYLSFACETHCSEMLSCYCCHGASPQFKTPSFHIV